MTPERYEAAARLVRRALVLPERDRIKFVRALTERDAALGDEVLALLQAADAEQVFGEGPALGERFSVSRALKPSPAIHCEQLRLRDDCQVPPPAGQQKASSPTLRRASWYRLRIISMIAFVLVLVSAFAIWALVIA